MTTTLTRRVVPLLGVLALLLTLLVPQTNAAFATETESDDGETNEAEDDDTDDTEQGDRDDAEESDGSDEEDGSQEQDGSEEESETEEGADTGDDGSSSNDNGTNDGSGTDDGTNDQSGSNENGAESGSDDESDGTEEASRETSQGESNEDEQVADGSIATQESGDVQPQISNGYLIVVWQTPLTSSEWDDAGQPEGAGSPEVWPQDLVGFVETGSANLNAADHLVPDCGVFQVDVYEDSQPARDIIASGTLDSNGTADDSAVLVGGGKGTAWKMVDAGECLPELQLTFMQECAGISQEEGIATWRVQGLDGWTAADPVDFTWSSTNGETGTETFDNAPVFFSTEWGEQTMTISVDGNEITVKAGGDTTKPRDECDVDINLQKIICEDHSQIRGNRSGNSPDDTDGGYQDWGTAGDVDNLTNSALPVTLYSDEADLPAGCSFAEGWSFFGGLGQNAVKTAGQSGTAGSGVTKTAASTGSDGIVNAMASDFLNPSDSYAFVQGDKRLWIAEEQQGGYEFGALQCYRDALNPDNLEFIEFGSNGPTGDVNCVAWNVHGSIDVEPTKDWDFLYERQPFDSIETTDASVPPGIATIGLYVDGEDDPSAIWTIDTEGDVTDDSAQQGPYTLPFGANYEFREIDDDVEGYRCINAAEQEAVRTLDSPADGESGGDTIVNLCEPNPTVTKLWVDVNDEPVDAPDPSSTQLTIDVTLDDGSTVELTAGDFTKSGDAWIGEVEGADFGTYVTGVSETVVPSGYEQVQDVEDCMALQPSSIQEAEHDDRLVEGRPVAKVCNRELPPSTSTPTRSLELEVQEVCLIDDLTEVIEFETDGEYITGDATLTVTNEVGTVVATYDVTVGEDGQIPWAVADDQLPFGELTLTLEAQDRSASATVDLSVIAEECTEVEGEREELPEEEPEQDPTDDPDEPEETDEGDDTVIPVTDDTDEVLGETITASEAHPRTGASTLLLMLLGMLGVGLGTIMLRSRRHTAEDAS